MKIYILCCTAAGDMSGLSAFTSRYEWIWEDFKTRRRKEYPTLEDAWREADAIRNHGSGYVTPYVMVEPEENEAPWRVVPSVPSPKT